MSFLVDIEVTNDYGVRVVELGNSSSEGEAYWRFNDGDSENMLYLCRYTVIKKTKCGVWINHYDEKRFVLNNARKRYAYPTKELALESYKIRKRRQAAYAAAAVDRAERNLDLAEQVKL